jgi:hypothetical protein
LQAKFGCSKILKKSIAVLRQQTGTAQAIPMLVKNYISASKVFVS